MPGSSAARGGGGAPPPFVIYLSGSITQLVWKGESEKKAAKIERGRAASILIHGQLFQSCTDKGDYFLINTKSFILSPSFFTYL